jgi:methylaspartate ammonia-lyase
VLIQAPHFLSSKAKWIKVLSKIVEASGKKGSSLKFWNISKWCSSFDDSTFLPMQ